MAFYGDTRCELEADPTEHRRLQLRFHPRSPELCTPATTQVDLLSEFEPALVATGWRQGLGTVRISSSQP